MASEHFPPRWSNQAIILYHGTTLDAAQEIVAGRIALRHGKRGTDFGPGFYTTTIETQARRWSIKVSEQRKVKKAVVELILDREEMARLDFLAFVYGAPQAEHFWSFVHYCRNGETDHGRVLQDDKGNGYYDVVFGPFAAIWNKNRVMPDSDQISFHTEKSIRMLNTLARRRMIIV